MTRVMEQKGLSKTDGKKEKVLYEREYKDRYSPLKWQTEWDILWGKKEERQQRQKVRNCRQMYLKRGRTELHQDGGRGCR